MALNFEGGLKRKLVIDADQPRNKVTEESNGYPTQYGISPSEFKEKAWRDALNYDGVSLENDRVTYIEKSGEHFVVSTTSGKFTSRQMLLAACLKEDGSYNKNFDDFFGTLVFYRPWCDGYELKS